MNQYSNCTIEPNAGLVEVPKCGKQSKKKEAKPNPIEPCASAVFCPRFVLED
jgi:ribosome-binding ATPase YchF (GTP1/OBG family)